MNSVFGEIRRAGDPDSLTENEKTHVPLIEILDEIRSGMLFAVTVKVGTTPHDLETTHFIQFIDLYVDQIFVSRITFTPAVIKPKATFYLVLEGPVTLRAIACCNQHGFWESERLVTPSSGA